MVEYLYNCIRATAGADETIAAVVSNNAGQPITAGIYLVLHYGDNEMLTIDGNYNAESELWEFPLTADFTKNLKGKCWYCFRHYSDQLCFKQPIYFV